jgi:hypothetical protein
MEIDFSDGKINLYGGIGVFYLGKYLYQIIQKERKKIK